MYSVPQRKLLFLLGWIPARLLLVYVAYSLPEDYLPYFGLLLLIPALSFLILYLFFHSPFLPWRTSFLPPFVPFFTPAPPFYLFYPLCSHSCFSSLTTVFCPISSFAFHTLFFILYLFFIYNLPHLFYIFGHLFFTPMVRSHRQKDFPLYRPSPCCPFRPQRDGCIFLHVQPVPLCGLTFH